MRWCLIGENPALLQGLEELFQSHSRSAGGQGRDLVLYGVGDGADTIAREYYQRFVLEEPLAAVLVFPSVGALELNQLTCPYLVIQFADQTNADELGRAVLHHQMRYGDGTDRLVVAARDHLDRESLSLIDSWLKRVEHSRRALPPDSSDVGSVA